MGYKLNDTYEIDSDRYNMILRKKRIVKDGKNAGNVEYDDFGYFSSLANLLKKYIHVNLIENKEVNVDDLMFKLDELNDKIDEIGKDIDYKLWNKNMK